MKTYRIKNAEKLRAYRKAHYSKNRDKILAEAKVYAAAHPGDRARRQRLYQKRHPDRVKDQYLRREYGVPLGFFSATMASQCGRCALCGEDMSPQEAVLDHCHSTGAVRGLLHPRCNTLIAMAKDRPEVCVRAAAYLNYWLRESLEKEKS
jgi:hypothetical protein